VRKTAASGYTHRRWRAREARCIRRVIRKSEDAYQRGREGRPDQRREQETPNSPQAQPVAFHGQPSRRSPCFPRALRERWRRLRGARGIRTAGLGGGRRCCRFTPGAVISARWLLYRLSGSAEPDGFAAPSTREQHCGSAAADRRLAKAIALRTTAPLTWRSAALAGHGRARGLGPRAVGC